MADNFGQVGSATVVIQADMRKLGDDLRNAAPQLRGAAEVLGASIGARMGMNVSRSFSKQLDVMGTGLQKIGTIGRNAGAALTAAITVPLVAATTAAIKFGGEFQSKMVQSQAIMEDLSETMKRDMAEAAKEVARTSKFGAAEAAEAFYFLASAGLEAEQSIKALPVVAKFAQAGMFDLSQATELLVDSQTALGLSSQNATQNQENMIRVANVITKANKLATGTTKDFATALQNRAAAALKIVNKDVEEGVAVLAAFAKQGVKGQTAGQQLAIVMRDLQTKAIRNKEAFKTFNVEVFDSTGNMRHMADILADLEKALDGASDAQKKEIFGLLDFQDRSVGALLQLIGMSKEIRKFDGELRNAAGTLDEVSKKQLEQFNVKMQRLKNQVELAGIALFTALEPTINEIVIPALMRLIQFAESAAKAFGTLPKPVREFIIIIGTIGAIAGPAIFVLGTLAGSMGNLLRALSWLAGGRGLAVIGGAKGLGAALRYLAGTSVLVGFRDLTSILRAFFGGMRAGMIDQLRISWALFAGAMADVGRNLVLVGRALIAGNLAAGFTALKAAILGLHAVTLPAWMTVAALAALAYSVYSLVDAWIALKDAQNEATAATNRSFNAAQELANKTAKELGVPRLTPENAKVKPPVDNRIPSGIGDVASETFESTFSENAKREAEFNAKVIAQSYEARAKAYKLERKAGEELADFYRRITAEGIRLSNVKKGLTTVTKKAIDVTDKEWEAVEKGTDAQAEIQAKIDAVAASKEKTKSVTEQMVNQVVRENEESVGLASALRTLESRHIDQSVILEKLGPTILDTASDLGVMGAKIDPIILKYAAAAKSQEAFTKAEEEWQAVRQKTIDLFGAAEQELTDGIRRDAETGKILDKFVDPMSRTGKFTDPLREMYDYNRTPEIPIERQPKDQAFLDSIADVGRRVGNLAELEKRIEGLAIQGKSAAEIQEILKFSFTEVHSEAAKLGVQLSDTTLRVLDEAEAARQLQAGLDAIDLENIGFSQFTRNVKEMVEAEYSAVDIQRALGGSLESITEQASRLGVELDPVVRKIYEEAEAAEQLRRALLNLESAQRAFSRLTRSIQEMALAGKDALEMERALGFSFEDLREEARLLGRELDPLTKIFVEQARAMKHHLRAVKAFEDQIADAVSGLSTGAVDLAFDALFDRTQKLQKNERELNRLAEEFNIEKRRVNETVKQYYERIKEASKANAEFEDAFKNADAGETFFRKLADLAKDTSKSMLKSIVDGFLSPLHSEMEKFGRGLANLLSGWIFGKAGGEGGVLGSIFGGLGGKLPGTGVILNLLGGGAGAGSLIGTAAGVPLVGMEAATGALASSLGLGTAGATGTAATVGATTGGGAVAGMTALLTNPITAALGAALGIGLGIKATQVHPIADIWTENVQSVFDRIVEDLDKAVESGMMTWSEGQAQKLTAIQKYLESLFEFSKQSTNKNIVARQALATFEQFYGDPKNFGVDIQLEKRNPFNRNLITPGVFNISPVSLPEPPAGSTATDIDEPTTTTPKVGTETVLPATGLATSASRIFAEAVDKLLPILEVFSRAVEGLTALVSVMSASTDSTRTVEVPVADLTDIPQAATGGLLERTGLVYAHKGETITPQGLASKIGAGSTEPYEMVPTELQGLVQRMGFDHDAAPPTAQGLVARMGFDQVRLFETVQKQLAVGVPMGVATAIQNMLGFNPAITKFSPMGMVPQLAGGGGMPQLQVVLQIHASPQINVSENFDPLYIRNTLIPEIVRSIKNGIAGSRSELAKTVADSLDGLTKRSAG